MRAACIKIYTEVNMLLLILIILLFFLTAYISYRVCFYHDPSAKKTGLQTPLKKRMPRTAAYDEQIRKMTEDFGSRPYEKVYTRSFDGLRLAARYMHVSDSAPICILMHGYKGKPLRDFSGGGPMLLNAGYNVLLVDERACGSSGGKTISFGVNERRDAVSWVEFCEKRFGSDRKLFLVGISMGASTVLMASELLKGTQVRGIIADCPYDSPRKIIEKVALEDMKLPALLLFYVKIGARLFGRFDIEACSATGSVKNSDIPFLVIHGDADRFVPEPMSRAMNEARPDISRRVIFEGAGHGMSYFADTARYRDECLDFIRDHE